MFQITVSQDDGVISSADSDAAVIFQTQIGDMIGSNVGVIIPALGSSLLDQEVMI